jgi:hypothetical protein
MTDGLLAHPDGCDRCWWMVIQDRPAWNPSRISFSNSARSSVSGTPHSVS